MKFGCIPRKNIAPQDPTKILLPAERDNDATIGAILLANVNMLRGAQ
jgi:hypothetical protein